MSLRQTIQGAVATAFKATDDIPKPAVLIKANPTYEPVSGNVIQGGTQINCSAIFVRYNAKQIDGERIQPTDLKMLLEAATVSAPPEIGDIIQVDSLDWKVVNIGIDPTGSLYVSQLRRG